MSPARHIISCAAPASVILTHWMRRRHLDGDRVAGTHWPRRELLCPRHAVDVPSRQSARQAQMGIAPRTCHVDWYGWRPKNCGIIGTATEAVAELPRRVASISRPIHEHRWISHGNASVPTSRPLCRSVVGLHASSIATPDGRAAALETAAEMTRPLVGQSFIGVPARAPSCMTGLNPVFISTRGPSQLHYSCAYQLEQIKPSAARKA